MSIDIETTRVDKNVKWMPAVKIGDKVIPLISITVSHSKDDKKFYWYGECVAVQSVLSGENGDFVLVTKDGKIRPFDDSEPKIAFGRLISFEAANNTFQYEIEIMRHVKIDDRKQVQ